MYNKESLVPRGIEPICGWQWVRSHYHDLDNWTPTIIISRDGYRVEASSKDVEVLNQVTKLAMRS